jgi:hypothetical protein
MTTSTPTLTAGQVAQYIQRPDEPLGAAIARFRNWEKTGIIKAAGDSNPGTGRKKQYYTSAVLRAVLLQTLIDTFGSSAVSLSELTSEIGQLIVNASWLRESELLVLSRPRGGERFTIRKIRPGQIRNYISGASVDVHVVIDLKRLFDRIDHDWRKKFYEPSRYYAKTAALDAAQKQIEAQFGLRIKRKTEIPTGGDK